MDPDYTLVDRDLDDVLSGDEGSTVPYLQQPSGLSPLPGDVDIGLRHVWFSIPVQAEENAAKGGDITQNQSMVENGSPKSRTLAPSRQHPTNPHILRLIYGNHSRYTQHVQGDNDFYYYALDTLSFAAIVTTENFDPFRPRHCDDVNDIPFRHLRETLVTDVFVRSEEEGWEKEVTGRVLLNLWTMLASVDEKRHRQVMKLARQKANADHFLRLCGAPPRCPPMGCSWFDQLVDNFAKSVHGPATKLLDSHAVVYLLRSWTIVVKRGKGNGHLSMAYRPIPDETASQGENWSVNLCPAESRAVASRATKIPRVDVDPYGHLRRPLLGIDDLHDLCLGIFSSRMYECLPSGLMDIEWAGGV
ncbi:uncharacterized protein FPOAC1_013453 [Fusarium poae]|uniref:uncharacterized protein n=1 Tax=Fusarium poae TaxID=36050 RepID=UPI001D0548A9|nr:uncharacterized protein FPOAC1_013453 [Fusarium poae]KAG8664673.1 hypothetical protein FPOAC1_013453 [Fusarium poae]